MAILTRNQEVNYKECEINDSYDSLWILCTMYLDHFVDVFVTSECIHLYILCIVP